jgi:hypothetical protein
MNANPVPNISLPAKSDSVKSEAAIAQLIGQVYETAPLDERSRLIGHLMKPLGVLSLVALANGIFAKIRFRSGWPEMNFRVDDVQNVQVSDVVTLAEHVQQVSVQAINSLADLLTNSPVLASSAAAALLVTVLLRRSKNYRADD